MAYRDSELTEKATIKEYLMVQMEDTVIKKYLITACLTPGR